MTQRFYLILSLAIMMLYCHPVSSQEITIELGPDRIGINQVWTVSVTKINERLEFDRSVFPDIKGFEKQGTSTNTAMNTLHGIQEMRYTVTQQYVPTAQGTVIVPPFTMTINDRLIKSSGKKVTVIPWVESSNKSHLLTLFNGSPVTAVYDSISPHNFTRWEFSEPDSQTIVIDAKLFIEYQPSISYGYIVGKRNNLSDVFKELPGQKVIDYTKAQAVAGQFVTINDRKYITYSIYRIYFTRDRKNLELPEFTFYMSATKKPINKDDFARGLLDTKTVEVAFKFESQKLKTLRKHSQRK